MTVTIGSNGELNVIFDKRFLREYKNSLDIVYPTEFQNTQSDYTNIFHNDDDPESDGEERLYAIELIAQSSKLIKDCDNDDIGNQICNMIAAKQKALETTGNKSDAKSLELLLVGVLLIQDASQKLRALRSMKVERKEYLPGEEPITVGDRVEMVKNIPDAIIRSCENGENLSDENLQTLAKEWGNHTLVRKQANHDQFKKLLISEKIPEGVKRELLNHTMILHYETKGLASFSEEEVSQIFKTLKDEDVKRKFLFHTLTTTMPLNWGTATEQNKKSQTGVAALYADMNLAERNAMKEMVVTMSANYAHKEWGQEILASCRQEYKNKRQGFGLFLTNCGDVIKDVFGKKHESRLEGWNFIAEMRKHDAEPRFNAFKR